MRNQSFKDFVSGHWTVKDMEMIEKNQEGVGEKDRVDAEEEDLVFEVDIAGDGDCFYSSIVEAFSRSSADLSDEVFLTKFLPKNA